MRRWCGRQGMRRACRRRRRRYSLANSMRRNSMRVWCNPITRGDWRNSRDSRFGSRLKETGLRSGPAGSNSPTWDREWPARTLESEKYSGCLAHVGGSVAVFAQHIAAAPHRLDVVLSAGCNGKLLAELADKDVDDLQLRLVHAAIKVVEEHLFGEGGAFAQREKLE